MNVRPVPPARPPSATCAETDATSSDKEVSGLWTAKGCKPRSRSSGITFAHDDPSAKAPWTRITLRMVSGIGWSPSAIPEADCWTPRGKTRFAFQPSLFTLQLVGRVEHRRRFQNETGDRPGLRKHGHVAAGQGERGGIHTHGGITFSSGSDHEIVLRHDMPGGLGTPCGGRNLIGKAARSDRHLQCIKQLRFLMANICARVSRIPRRVRATYPSSPYGRSSGIAGICG